MANSIFNQEGLPDYNPAPLDPVSVPDDAPDAQKAAASGANAAAAQASLASGNKKAAMADYYRVFTSPPVRQEPKIEQAPKWEDSQEYQNAKVGKAGMAMGFGLLIASLVGPLFMRTGAKGAMSSLTHAINGWNEGDREKWQDARDTYDKHLKYIQHNNEKMMAEADKIFRQENVDYNTRLNNARIFALKWDMVEKDSINSYEHFIKQLNTIDAANKRLVRNNEVGQVTLDSATIKRLGVEYAQTGKMPTRISNRKEDLGNRDAIERAKTAALDYYEKNQSWPNVPTGTEKGLEYNADKGSLKKLTERSTMIGAFSRTAEANFNIILDEAKKLDAKGKLPTFKKWADVVQAYQVRWKGDPEVVPYVQAVYETGIEYGKVVQGNTGNVALTDSAKEDMARLFSSANSYQTVKKTVDMGRKMVASRMGGFQAEIDSINKKYVNKSDVSRGTSEVVSTIEDAEKSGWTYAGKYKKDPSRQVWRDKDGRPHVF